MQDRDTGRQREVGGRTAQPYASPAVPAWTPSAEKGGAAVVRTATTTSRKKKMQRSKRVRIIAAGYGQPHPAKPLPPASGGAPLLTPNRV